jgi:hypothetical protein
VRRTFIITIIVIPVISALESCSGIIRIDRTYRFECKIIEEEIEYSYGDTLSINVELFNGNDTEISIPIEGNCFNLNEYIPDSIRQKYTCHLKSRFYNIRLQGTDSAVNLKAGEKKSIKLYFLEYSEESPSDQKTSRFKYALTYTAARKGDNGYTGYLCDSDDPIIIETHY